MKPDFTFVSLVTFAGALLWLNGCSRADPSVPPTFPVNGQVLMSDGKPPVGACVQFQPKASQFDLRANGIVDETGRFSLSLPFRNQLVSGATVGPHRVTVVMPPGSKYSSLERVVVDREYVVEPLQNTFTIKLKVPVP